MSDEYWNEEFPSKLKLARTTYRCPLPKKLQRVFLRGRSGKVKHYTKEEIDAYIAKRVRHELDKIKDGERKV